LSNQTTQLLLQLSFFPGHISSFWDDGGEHVLLPFMNIGSSLYTNKNQNILYWDSLKPFQSIDSVSKTSSWLESEYLAPCSDENYKMKATSSMISRFSMKHSTTPNILWCPSVLLVFRRKSIKVRYCFKSNVFYLLGLWCDFGNWRNGWWQRYFTWQQSDVWRQHHPHTPQTQILIPSELEYIVRNSNDGQKIYSMEFSFTCPAT
jgi:hypothetical protein